MKKLAIGLYATVTVALMIWGFYQAIYVAPTDAMQGEIFRIIFYHVPSASVAFLFFAISLLGSIGYLAYRHSHPEWAQVADAWALAGAEVGIVFCTVVLTTGPLWGRRAWGIWWTWDARLTTTLVLWLIYVSYLLLRRFAAGPQVQTLAAVLGIFGALVVTPLLIVYLCSMCRSSICRIAGGARNTLRLFLAARRVLAWTNPCSARSCGTCSHG